MNEPKKLVDIPWLLNIISMILRCFIKLNEKLTRELRWRKRLRRWGLKPSVLLSQENNQQWRGVMKWSHCYLIPLTLYLIFKKKII